MTIMYISYGVILDQDDIESIASKLFRSLSLTEQKAVYAGVFGTDYDASELNDVDSDDPDFLVTDFGESLLTVDITKIIENLYPLLYPAWLDDEDQAVIYVYKSSQAVESCGYFDTEKIIDDNPEGKAEMDRFIADMGITENARPVARVSYY